MSAVSAPATGVATLAMVLLTAAIVVGVAQLGGLLAARWRQPAVIGEMVGVIVAGPGVLGTLAPSVTHLLFPPAVLDVIGLLGGIGVVLFVFAVGMEMPRDLLRGTGRMAAVVGTSAFVLPALSGVGLGLLLAAFAPRLGTDTPTEILFLGVAMGMTAFPVLARILQDVAGLRPGTRVLGLTLAGCADAYGWGGLVLLMAGNPATGVIRLLAAGCGVAAVIVVGRAVLRRLARWSQRQSIPILADGGSVLAILLASAALSEMGGLHSVVGALVAGLTLPRTDRVLALARTLNTVSSVLLLPMFFVGVSASVQLGDLTDPTLLILLVVVPMLAIGTKVLGAWLPARALGLSNTDGLALGAMASCRGLTEIVVLVVGRQTGLLSGSVFTVFVLMSLLATVLTGPALRRLTTRTRSRRVGPVRHGGSVRPDGDRVDGHSEQLPQRPRRGPRSRPCWRSTRA